MAFQHSTDAKLVGNGVNLGAIAKSFEAEGVKATSDATVIDDTGRTWTFGVESGSYKAEGFLDAGSTGASAWEMISAAFGQQGVIISAPLGDAAGKPAIGLVAGGTRAATQQVTGETVGYSLDGETRKGFEPGVMLLPWSARTGTVNGSTVDAGASSANGASAFLVVGAFTGTTCTVKIQHSVDGSTWADAATFTAVTAGRVGERIEIAPGTLNRRRRAIISGGTFSSIELAVALAAK